MIKGVKRVMWKEGANQQEVIFWPRERRGRRRRYQNNLENRGGNNLQVASIVNQKGQP